MGRFRKMESVFRPQRGISYDFIFYSYLTGTIFGLCLMILHLCFDVESVKGYWVIFVPFLPCLGWAALMRSKAKLLKVEHLD